MSYMIVDAHTHVTTKEAVKGLEISPVSMVAASISAFNARGNALMSENKRMKALADEFPNIVIPYCTVNPLDGEKALEELRRCVEEDKMRGMKLHPLQQRFSMMGETVIPVLKEAGVLGIPVMFHDATLPAVCPTQVAYVAKRCPETIVILGHSGWQNHWRKAVRAAKLTDNILCCTALSSLAGIQSIMEAVGVDRVVFGSDYPCAGVRAVESQIYELSKIRALDISEEEKEMILGKNMLQVLNL